MKTTTEEIQYLGLMLTATTDRDVDRLSTISNKLNKISTREQ